MSTPPLEKPSGDSKPEGARRRPLEMFRTGGLIALAVLITLFAVLNSEEVKVEWIVGSGHAPLIVVIVISLLVGIVLTYSAERLRKKRH